MNIRVALDSDIKHIAELHTKSWRVAYKDVLNKKYLAEDIENDRLSVWSERFLQTDKNQIVLVAEDKNCFLGFACLYLNADAKWGALLDNLHVQPELKGNGIGKALMQEVVKRCENQAGLYLGVLECNIAAQGFYKKLGALHSESYDWNPPGGGVVNTFRFTWAAPITLIM